MQVVYHLWSETTPDWLRVIADGLSREDPRVPSVTFLWKGAEWMEREAYDMFGITFEGNRDLRRIYMPPDYQSFPLRKDFYLPDDAARSPGARRPPHGADPLAPQRDAGGPDPDRPGHDDARAHGRATPPPTTRGSCSTSRPASSSRSRRTRRGPSARPSSTRSATARCSSTWARSTRRPTASCGSSSSSTARRSSTSIRSSATSIGASRSSARTPTTTRSSARSTRSSTCRSLFCEWPPVMAFEKLLDVEVPRRAEYIRVLSAELNRIASHALFMGWMALDLGGLTPILWSFIERDEIVEMLASLTGQRMLFNYFRIGGVNGDLNHEFMSRLGDWMSRATTQIEANARAPQRERDLRPPDARPRA